MGWLSAERAVAAAGTNQGGSATVQCNGQGGGVLRPEMTVFSSVIPSANHMQSEMIVGEAMCNFSFLGGRAGWQGEGGWEGGNQLTESHVHH